MHVRKLLSGTLAVVLLAGAAHAGVTGQAGEDAPRSGFSLPLPDLGIQKLFGAKRQGEVLTAQVADPRVQALEEQVRGLSGTLEELNFQILQMQEQLRKMQEDNEFRFQELEGKGGSGAAAPAGDDTPALPSKPRTEAAPPAGAQTAATTPTPPAAVGDGPVVEEVIVDNGSGEPSAARAPGIQPGVAGADGGTGAPPTTFGTITFDDRGNVKSGAVGDAIVTAPLAPGQPAPAATGTDSAVVAALPSTDDPDELYRNSYEFILSGDYGTAEAGFRDHIARFPADPRTADARFWLGESLLGQKKYRDAAETLLAANKEYPSAKKAPDMLLKLGVSLVALDQRDVACATFAEVGKRYPNISGALKDRVKQEQALASC